MSLALFYGLRSTTPYDQFVELLSINKNSSFRYQFASFYLSVDTRNFIIHNEIVKQYAVMDQYIVYQKALPPYYCSKAPILINALEELRNVFKSIFATLKVMRFEITLYKDKPDIDKKNEIVPIGNDYIYYQFSASNMLTIHTSFLQASNIIKELGYGKYIAFDYYLIKPLSPQKIFLNLTGVSSLTIFKNTKKKLFKKSQVNQILAYEMIKEELKNDRYLEVSKSYYHYVKGLSVYKYIDGYYYEIVLTDSCQLKLIVYGKRQSLVFDLSYVYELSEIENKISEIKELINYLGDLKTEIDNHIGNIETSINNIF